MAAPRSGRLRVAASHSFASIWLLPRLATLLEETGVDVELVVGASFDALASNEADIGIWGGRVAPSGLKAVPLFEVTAVPVAPERLANGRAPPRPGESLGDFPLVSVHRPKDLWQRWLGVAPRQVRSFDTLHMMYEASAAGLGVALATPLAVPSPSSPADGCASAQASHAPSAFPTTSSIRRRDLGEASRVCSWTG